MMRQSSYKLSSPPTDAPPVAAGHDKSGKVEGDAVARWDVDADRGHALDG